MLFCGKCGNSLTLIKQWDNTLWYRCRACGTDVKQKLGKLPCKNYLTGRSYCEECGDMLPVGDESNWCFECCNKDKEDKDGT